MASRNGSPTAEPRPRRIVRRSRDFFETNIRPASRFYSMPGPLLRGDMSTAAVASADRRGALRQLCDRSCAGDAVTEVEAGDRPRIRVPMQPHQHLAVPFPSIRVDVGVAMRVGL